MFNPPAAHRPPTGSHQMPVPFPSLMFPNLISFCPVVDDVVNNLCAFREFSALKRLALEVVAFSLEPTQIKGERVVGECPATARRMN